MTEQKKMLFGKRAYATIKSTKRIDCLTNTSYDLSGNRRGERQKR